MRIDTNIAYTYNKPERIKAPVEIDWGKYPNFKESEFKCTASDLCKMEPDFLEAIQILRKHFGRPLKISSGYRDPTTHPIESAKAQPGVHAYGLAADIIISHGLAYDLLNMVMTLKIFTGIGIQQKGHAGQRFIHIDIATPHNYRMDVIRPTVWSY